MNIEITSTAYTVENRGFETPCWMWRGGLVNGYGRFHRGHRKWWYAHRAMYEQEVGPIPNGMHLHHRCENRRCVRPSHLVLVTRSEHMWTHNLPGRGWEIHRTRTSAEAVADPDSTP